MEELTMIAACLYCDTERKVSFMPTLIDGQHYETAIERLERLAASQCPCLNYTLWQVTHRGTQRRLVRERLELMQNDPYVVGRHEYLPVIEALSVRLRELQPRA